MSRTYKDMKFRIVGKRRKEIDARRIARALISLAESRAAQATPPANRQPKRNKPGRDRP